MKFGKRVTSREEYNPAMEISDPDKAANYLDSLVERAMRVWGLTREEAEMTERCNIGYHAGYFSEDMRRKVEKVFWCSHPVFGKAEGDE